MTGLGAGLAACHPFDAAGLGDPKAGAAVIDRQQCGSCHVIPGVANADGEAGPSLAGFAGRSMIGGMLPNSPAGLVAWLRSPQSVVPGNAMPDMGLSQQQAQDVAAYLYTLR